MRACPYCDSRVAEHFGRRHRALFLRCASCRAVFMELTEEEFAKVHAKAFEDAAFLDRVQFEKTGAPATDKWQEIAPLLGDGSVLEIGPGSGHLLAAARAAGREVAGVETSLVHREFIRRRWGIERLWETIDDVPNAERFGNVCMINTIEHVYDVVAMMKQVVKHLLPGAKIFIATCNAGGLIARTVGTMWAMFKPMDHVSIPSPASIHALARRVGVDVERVWTAELPLETPISFAVALRDLYRERVKGEVTVELPTDHLMTPGDGPARVPLSRRARVLLTRNAQRLDPTRVLVERLGVAATVRAILVAGRC